MSTDYKPQGIGKLLLHVSRRIDEMYSLLSETNGDTPDSDVTRKVVEELTDLIVQIGSDSGNARKSLLEILIASGIPLPELIQLGVGPRLETYPPRDLIPKELEVLGLAAEGYSNGQIAEQMNLAEITVKKHVGNAYLKLSAIGADNRVLATIWYKEHYDPEYKLGPITDPIEPLIKTELEAVRGVAGGGSYKTIAAESPLTMDTVKETFYDACKKIGIYEGDLQVLAGLWHYQRHGLPPYKPS